jgi:hypothetical protein
MLMWTRRQTGVLERSKMSCHVVGQIFALVILASWITSALADPLTLPCRAGIAKIHTIPHD